MAFLIELGEKSNVGMVAFYHLVPVPPYSLLEDVFMHGAPDKFLLNEGFVWFEVPIAIDDIVVNRPWLELFVGNVGCTKSQLD